MTRGSIFAKAGNFSQEILTKGIIGCVGYGFGTLIFSQAPRLRRYELRLQEAREIIENHEGALRSLDKCEEELVRLEGTYKKALMEYSSRASKN